MKRVVFVEPEIENPGTILDIFKKHNPDSNFVNPHICLVFPFESDLDTRALKIIMNDVLSKHCSFTIQLSGLSVSYEGRNNFLFLNVIDERNILKQMNSDLYNRLGDNAKLKGQYAPHITLGKSKSIDEIKQINVDLQDLLQPIYNATITNIFCKKIIHNSNGNIKLVDEIEFSLP